jgi:Zn-dependent peptidase ImmA (M78 family)/DNA-binding XRE family transcriptional regulator
VAARIPVSPQVLRWARASAGYTEDQAAKGLGVSRKTLDRWESGDLAPTINQLRNAAQRYNRPLAALMLPSPPTEPELPVADFRRLEAYEDPRWSPQLRAAIHRALNQRATMLEISEIAPDAIPVGEAVNFTLPESDADLAAAQLREILELDSIPKTRVRKPYDFLSAVTRRAESLGILVMHTAGVSTKEMKGFSIAETPFPVIAINGSDWPRSRLFTLLHEMAHIGLRASGLCDMHEVNSGTVRQGAGDIEQYCNAVAANTLMPAEAFLAYQAEIGGSSSGWTLADLERLSAYFGASSEAALIRLVLLGVVPWTKYHERKPELDQAYEDARERQKQERKESEKPGAPSYYTVKARDLGRSYIHSVFTAYEDDAISSRDVANYLGVRFDQLPKLMEVVNQ